MFRVGQKVVCIGSAGTPGTDWEEWCRYWKVARPERGKVYTIRDIRMNAAGKQFVRLYEIVNPPVEFHDAPTQEPWWWATAFRPAVDRKTDISEFKAILNPEKINEPA